jgi:hypothetical protein
MGRIARTSNAAQRGGVYAALRASEEARYAKWPAWRGPRNHTVEALRAGRPVTVNLFRVPKEFRPDDISPSAAVTVYPDGRIELWAA